MTGQGTGPTVETRQADNRLRLARVALSRLAEPGHRGLTALVRGVGAVTALERVTAGTRGRVEDLLRERLGDVNPWARAADDLTRGHRQGARLVVPEDAEWPHVPLSDLTALAQAQGAPVEPPICLWVRGSRRLDEAVRRAVAIVGARASTPYGNHVATELGYGLAERSWTVVSGLAYGIDGAAHRGALAAGGLTVAVLACGVDNIYPIGHAALFDRIADDGLLISEWPPGATPQRHRFLVRNRVIAALAAGTVVVEAAARSGTAVTATRADELGRAVMAVPGPVTSAMSVGTHELVRDRGASLVTSAADVAQEVGRIGEGIEDAGQPPPLTVRDRLPPELARVLDGLPAHRCAAAEQIAVQCGVSLLEVQRALPALAARRLVEQVPGGFRLTTAARADASRPPPIPPRLR